MLSGIPLCICLPLLASAAGPVQIALALLMLGASIGAIDVTMNLQAVIVEQASGRTLMSGFHGLYSVGGIVGALLVTALLGAGATPLLATLVVVAGIIIALLAAWPGLLSYGSNAGGASFAIPHGRVLFIGVLCFIAFLAEGAVLDWSAVYLTAVPGVAAAYAGLGYAVFASTMTIGRLTGDRVVRRFGGNLVIIAGGSCAAAGFVLGTLAPSWGWALLGFALIGIGCANIVPVLYTAAGRQPDVPEHVAVAAITTLGYAGILTGPALIGFVAQASSLRVAFAVLAAMQVAVAASGRVLRTG
jgi:predicted MFS family arabinose efflux permease